MENRMIDSLRWLLSSENFMPHGHCFLWQPATLWLNVGSDGLIAASYLAIPVVIYSFLRRKETQIRYAWVPALFAAFIFLCGGTHLMEIWTVWNPDYRIAGALKLITGIVSFATLGLLIWVMPRALLLKTPGQLHAEVELRTRELLEANEQLRAQIAARDMAEQQLSVSEAKRARDNALLRTIVESAPTLIYAKDLDGRMLLANPPALALIGKPWSQVEGRTDLEFLADQAQGNAITVNDRRLMLLNQTEQFEEVVGNDAGEDRVWMSVKAPLRDSAGTVTGLVGVSVEITEHKRLEHRLRIMVDELNHRVKNTLATVQAIAAQTLRSMSLQFYNAFQDRLLALAAAHDVLTRERWAGAELHDVVAGQLGPYAGTIGERLHVTGPKIRLNSNAALALAMGLHELAVNALKYGALSNEAGQVSIDWEIVAGDAPSLRLTWTERHGPTVDMPQHKGFGSRLIERILAQNLGGMIQLRFDDPAGVTCVIEAPLSQVIASANAPAFPRVGAPLGVRA
jgi:PAS domain S-box-containing protein